MASTLPRKRSRAFVAAPLIGTILFLSAVLFTVNLDKIEAAQSARIVNDAYHNRIVSLIEIYRTDLASVFRESVRRNIQDFILTPDWDSLGLKNTDDAGNFLNFHDIRLNRCNLVRDLSRNATCTLGSASVSDSYGYGIPAWITVANQSFSFEGIRFQPANPDQMTRLNPDRTDPVAINNYFNHCNNLIQNNLFDCQYFADHPDQMDTLHPNGPFQCVDENGVFLPGCEEGTFYIKVDPRGISAGNPAGDGQLYAAMPRIEGDDGFGNQVRSGAIGDEPFYIAIDLRAFYYDDLALEFYDKMAFNSDSAHHPDTTGNPGLAQGVCAGSAVACEDQAKIRTPIAPGTNFPFTAGMDTAAHNHVLDYVMHTLFKNGINSLKAKRATWPLTEKNILTGDYYTKFFLLYNPPSGTFPVCIDESAIDPVTHQHPRLPECKEIITTGSGLTPAETNLIPGIKDPPIGPYAGTPPGYTAYYNQVQYLHFYVLDSKPEFQLVGTEPNHPAYSMQFTSPAT